MNNVDKDGYLSPPEKIHQNIHSSARDFPLNINRHPCGVAVQPLPTALEPCVTPCVAVHTSPSLYFSQSLTSSGSPPGATLGLGLRKMCTCSEDALYCMEAAGKTEGGGVSGTAGNLSRVCRFSLCWAELPEVNVCDAARLVVDESPGVAGSGQAPQQDTVWTNPPALLTPFWVPHQV